MGDCIAFNEHVRYGEVSAELKRKGEHEENINFGNVWDAFHSPRPGVGYVRGMHQAIKQVISVVSKWLGDAVCWKHFMS